MEIRNKRGFTLTELMVVVGILGMFILIVFNLLSSINRTSMIVEWRSSTNTKLTEAFNILRRDLERANYPSVITDRYTYKNPISVGAGEYKNGAPSDDNILRIREGTDNKIVFDDKVEEMVLMKWQINTPEVEIDGKERASETTICTLKWYKEYDNKPYVITYKVQAPPKYNLLEYSNYQRIMNNREVILLKNVEYIKFEATPKYSEQQIDFFNRVKTNPTKSIPEDSTEYFHDWMTPYLLSVEVGIAESRSLRGVFLRKTNFKVHGNFTVDPVSVKVEFVNNVN